MKQLLNIISKYGGSCSPISFQNHTHFIPINPTCVVRNGELIINYRMTNYFLWNPRVSTPEISWFTVFDSDNDNVYSFNVIGRHDQTSNLVTLNPGYGPYSWWGQFGGYEDMRLVEWDGVLYGIVSRPDVVQDKLIVQLLEFNTDLTINRSWFISTESKIEKSWLPIEDRPFTFLYDPVSGATVYLDIQNMTPSSSIASVSDDELNHIKTPVFNGKYCGSSPVMRWGDGYICICHSTYRYTNNAGYYIAKYEHMFVEYDRDMNLVRIGEPFVFITPGVEFCCGLCKDDRNVYITFSCGDACSNLMSIPVDRFSEVVRECSTYGSYEHTDGYFESHIQEFLGIDRFAVGMNFIRNPNTVLNIIKYTESILSDDPYIGSQKYKDRVNGWLMQTILPHPSPGHDIYTMFK